MIDPEKNRYYSGELALGYLLDTTKIRALSKKVLSGSIIYEPCVGAGDLSNPLKALGATVIANDIDEEVEADHHGCVVRDEIPLGGVDCIITNPPFLTYETLLDDEGNPLLNAKGKPRKKQDLHATDFLKAFANHETNLIAMLLRLTYLEPTKNRRGILTNRKVVGENGQEFLLKEVIVTPRISFTGDNNTDSVTTAWVVFEKPRDQFDKFQDTRILFADGKPKRKSRKKT